MGLEWSNKDKHAAYMDRVAKGTVAAELLGDTYGARPVSKVRHEIEYGNGEYREVEIDEDGVIEVEASGPMVLAITGEREQSYEARTTDEAIYEDAGDCSLECARNRSLEWYADPENAEDIDYMIHLLDSENLDREYGHIHHENL